MKRCSACKEQKAIGEYWKGQSQCKECKRAWRDTNRENVRRAARKHYQKNRKKHARVGRENHLRRKFGITSAQYQAVLERQFGCCAICRQPPGERNLAVDHDHDSGAVRGLLCDRCNRLIGLASESPGILCDAATYVAGNFGRPGHLIASIIKPELLEVA